MADVVSVSDTGPLSIPGIPPGLPRVTLGMVGGILRKMKRATERSKLLKTESGVLQDQSIGAIVAIQCIQNAVGYAASVARSSGWVSIMPSPVTLICGIRGNEDMSQI